VIKLLVTLIFRRFNRNFVASAMIPTLGRGSVGKYRSSPWASSQ
jgi:hypothetical protein